MVTAYMAMYSCEITCAAFAVTFFALGAWMGDEHGKEKRFKRDGKGRFVK
jgi:hypothetical protein